VLREATRVDDLRSYLNEVFSVKCGASFSSLHASGRAGRSVSLTWGSLRIREQRFSLWIRSTSGLHVSRSRRLDRTASHWPAGVRGPQPRRPDRGRDLRPHPAALGIENLEHRPRDTVWREDDQQAHHGNAPRAMATLRNLALRLFAIHGITKSKQTVQSIGRNPLHAVPLIT
jgi:hypothetical protein